MPTTAPALRSPQQEVTERFGRFYAPLTIVLVLLGCVDVYAQPDSGDVRLGFTSMWRANAHGGSIGTLWISVLVVLVLLLLILSLTGIASRLLPIGAAVLGAGLLTLLLTYEEGFGKLDLAPAGQAVVGCTVLIVVVALLHLLALAWARVE